MIDYVRYYDRERYLFEDVKRRFHEEGSIGAFDLFSIVDWKSSRMKPAVAKRLAGRILDLETAARDLTRAIADAQGEEARLAVLMQTWGFRLATATAILSVLYPDEFTVYDTRVCGELGRFQELANRAATRVWGGYAAYRDAVIRATPDMPLRDRDRYLWGRSVASQLEQDIARGFTRLPE